MDLERPREDLKPDDAGQPGLALPTSTAPPPSEPQHASPGESTSPVQKKSSPRRWEALEASLQLSHLIWTEADGWSEPFPELDSAQTLVLAFADPELEICGVALDQLHRAYPSSVVVGCSSSGAIAQGDVLDHAISVAVVRFEHTRLRLSSQPIRRGDAARVGAALGESLAADDLRSVLVLSDGLLVNGTALSAGITEAVREDVVVTGGLAGDGDHFHRTWVFFGGEPRPECVVAIGLYGDRLEVGHGSRGGWDPFGPVRRVTASEGNVLRMIDHRPALALYKEYLGERAAGLPATALLFPLALRDPDAPDRHLVRTVLAIDEADQSMTFAGDLPEGSQVQLMRANVERLIDGAAEAAAMTLSDLGEDRPVLAIAISCVGRRLVLGQATEEEVEATQQLLPLGSVQVGFYSYGELSPAGVGSCELHNQTMTLTAWRER